MTETINKPNRLRRAIYVFGGTLMFSSMAFFALLFTDKTTSEIFIKGCLGIVELLVIMYIGTTTVDRSEILANLGKSMKKNAEPNDSQSSQIEPPRMPEQSNPTNGYQPDEDSKG